MPGVTTAGLNYAVQQLANVCTFAALLNPSGVEISGGSYARRPVSFSAAANGAADLASSVVFQIPAGAVIGKVGYYSLASGGVQYCVDDLDNNETYTGSGTLTIIAGTITLS